MKSSRIALAATLILSAAHTAAGQSTGLRPLTAFNDISDARARSAALFVEAATVITNPRCMNCHPATRQPTQGDDLHPHNPPMHGGPSDRGVPGLPCSSCHSLTNTTTLAPSIRSIPGHAKWSLAPPSMAWQGKSIREICLQVKDPLRNGNRRLTQIYEHMATDPLVGWAWHPGEGRVPAPGTQREFGSLIKAWISTGAHCPEG